ncbi:MAG TPA: LysR family transcriptional regulator [Methylibium sp.]|nr:LysR family transcriptional regulator [Methylibium sp.]
MRVSLISTQMRYFLSVAQTGSVSQAAAQLHVAASAVSRQITKLEDALGAALFDRKQRGMALTPAGERLATHLRAGAEEAERVIEQVQGLARQAKRQVRLACTEGFVAGFLPTVINSFRAEFPDARLQLSIAAPDEVSALLTRGDADLALKYCVAPEKGMTVQHAALAPICALMKPGHPLARKRALTVAEAVRYPLAVGAMGMTGRQLFDSACALQGLQYEAAVVSNFSSALLPLVHDTDIVLAGKLTAFHLVADGSLVLVPFADAQLQQRRLQLMSLEGRLLPPLAQSLAQRLIAAIECHGAPPPNTRKDST